MCYTWWYEYKQGFEHHKVKNDRKCSAAYGDLLYLHDPFLIFSTFFTADVLIQSIDVSMGVDRLLGQIIIKEIFIWVAVTFWGKEDTWV